MLFQISFRFIEDARPAMLPLPITSWRVNRKRLEEGMD